MSDSKKKTQPSSVTGAQRLAPSPSEIASSCATLLDETQPLLQRCNTAYALCSTLDDYLPEPALLDGILPDLVRSLSTGISEPALHSLAASATSYNPNTAMQPPPLLLFRVLQAAHKVRGAKLVVRHYPHEVAHFAPIARLALFAADHLSAPFFWRVRAVLFYWLANLALLPFPLSSFSTPDTVSALADAALAALNSPANSSHAAALFLARFVTRKDASHLLERAVSACLAAVADEKNATRRQGAFRAIAAICKIGRRDVLAPHAPAIMAAAAGAAAEATSATDAHLAAKLAQRVALVHLPPRPCSWSYSRGTRLLFGGLPSTASAPSPATGPASGTADDADKRGDEQVALSEAAHADVETALEVVLRALESRDVVVRWSGAKGVGRIAARLDAELAGEVAMHVLGTFDAPMDEGSWNGACLALAELLRRGLILPDSDAFAMTLDAVEKAAAFDIRRGAHSVGEHVRDAACYVVWALARAYEARDVRVHAKRIARAMLRVALLDREVHCRRAAAAALQECVGRMAEGVIVEGIFLITVADFFALGDRQAAYLDIAGKVAEVADGEYFDCVVEELVDVKLKHWDYSIRALAAKALVNQVKNDKHDFILKDVMPRLITLALTPGDVLHRHGAILGLAELLIPHAKSLSEADARRILEIQDSLESGGCYHGRSGDIVQKSVYFLTESLAKTVPAVYADSPDGRSHAKNMFRLLETGLASGMVEIREAAMKAYMAMCSHVLQKDVDWLADVQKSIQKGLKTLTRAFRLRALALAAGCIGGKHVSEDLVRALLWVVEESPNVEVRRNAVRSLGRLPEGFSTNYTREVLWALAKGMADYTVDDRGDVGSWVREAAMESVADIFEHVYRSPVSRTVDSLLPEDLVLEMLRCIVRQSCERIDRTRVKAGRVLLRVYHSLCPVFDKSGEVKSALDALSAAFCLEICETSEDEADESWTEAFSETERVFKSGTMLLQTSSVRRGALQGLVASAGGMGHQSAQAMSAIVSFASGLNGAEQKATMAAETSETLALEISSFFIGSDDRLVAPALCVAEHLAREGCFEAVPEEVCLEITARARKSWSGHLSDVGRTAAAVRLLGELACVRDANAANVVSRSSIEALVVVLAGVVPRLRRIAAEWLYFVLIELQECGGNEGLNSAMDKLCDTPWEQLKVLQAREVRNQFCGFVGVDKPVAKKIKRPATDATGGDRR